MLKRSFYVFANKNMVYFDEEDDVDIEEEEDVSSDSDFEEDIEEFGGEEFE